MKFTSVNLSAHRKSFPDRSGKLITEAQPLRRGYMVTKTMLACYMSPGLEAQISHPSCVPQTYGFS